MLFVGDVVRLASHASLEPGAEWWLVDFDAETTDASVSNTVPFMAQRLRRDRFDGDKE
jgi:hypothetical protein